MGKLPGRNALAPYLREDRQVPKDSFVSWEGSRYGVHRKWAGRTVQVGQRQGTVEIWAGDERIAVHPRAQHLGSVLSCPASDRVSMALRYWASVVSKARINVRLSVRHKCHSAMRPLYQMLKQ